MTITQYVARRLLLAVPVLLALALVTFMLIQALPGGPFSTAGLKRMPSPCVWPWSNATD